MGVTIFQTKPNVNQNHHVGLLIFTKQTKWRPKEKNFEKIWIRLARPVLRYDFKLKTTRFIFVVYLNFKNWDTGGYWSGPYTRAQWSSSIVKQFVFTNTAHIPNSTITVFTWYKKANTRNKIKKYTVAKTRFSLKPFKYLFNIPTRLLVIFNYEIREVIFYDFIAEMFAIALILIGVVRVLKTKLKN